MPKIRNATGLFMVN